MLQHVDGRFVTLLWQYYLFASISCCSTPEATSEQVEEFLQVGHLIQAGGALFRVFSMEGCPHNISLVPDASQKLDLVKEVRQACERERRYHVNATLCMCPAVHAPNCINARMVERRTACYILSVTCCAHEGQALQGPYIRGDGNWCLAPWQHAWNCMMAT